MNPLSTSPVTTTLPPRRVNLIALESRLIRICLMARLSATMSGSGGHAADQIDAGLARAQRHQVAAGIDHRRGAERLGRDLEIAALDLRHVENAVDDRQQVMAGLADQRRIFMPALLVEPHHLLVGEHLGEPDDRVERRAQLVAHGREEAALGGIRAHGFLARVFQRPLLAFALGHVADHRNHFALAVGAFGAIERAATHLDPDELGSLRSRRAPPCGCGIRPSCWRHWRRLRSAR